MICVKTQVELGRGAPRCGAGAAMACGRHYHVVAKVPLRTSPNRGRFFEEVLMLPVSGVAFPE